MDEILKKFDSSLVAEKSNDQNLTSFDGLYKNWGKLGNQEERRREILGVQRSNRRDKIDKFRGIFELVNAVEQSNIFHSSSNVSYRPTIYVSGFHRTSSTYSNVLMMSEWLVEKPDDFNENWFVVPCPKGVRMLVVANQGSTKCYSKLGRFRQEFRTELPGGHPSNTKRHYCCVLDGFYQEQNNTFYVLDLLAWKDLPMTDGETEFRHYWLETQMEEISGLKVISENNKMIFKLLPKVPCAPESFNKFMMTYPHFECHFPTLDGLLFYHKKAHYISGETPLVGWLYPYMVPEVLGADITVSKIYLMEQPEDYVNQADFIRKFEAKLEKKKNRSRRHSSNMDATDSTKIERQTEEATSLLEFGDGDKGGKKETTKDTTESMEDEVNAEPSNVSMEEDPIKTGEEIGDS